ncbi:pyridoxal-phosphate dependent enzyme [Streptomyces noursei]|uniref:pyridoxal-phosphate dependent enzyme n=1 Tax=Streptomyces noursei TaxID=1971 RepID=UPI00332A3631
MTGHPAPPSATWAARASARLAADAAPTPLRPLRLPALPGIDLHVKDESAHPTGSVKHRLLRELFRAAVEAAEVLAGLRGTRHPVPAWLVTGAGTGATAASLGHHLRRHRLPPRLAVADPEHSASFPAWASGCLAARLRSEGAGGSVVLVAGDGAEPYRATHLDADWLAATGLDPPPYEALLERFARTGAWAWPQLPG